MSDDPIHPRISVLSDDELYLIEEDYRKKKLQESLLGPSVSTLAHVILLICAAVFLKGAVDVKPSQVAITTVVEKIPPPPPPPPPPPQDLVTPPDIPTESPDPTITSVAINDSHNSSGLESTSDEPPSTADGGVADIVSDVKSVTSPTSSSKMFSGRRTSGRGGMITSFGGPVKLLQYTDKGLTWLAKVQKPDGSWGTATSDAFTGLALLCFLANGETPTSKKYGQTVERAINWLAASKGDGNADAHLYSHSIKTYALCEAFAMTGNYNLEEVMNANVRRIIEGQQAGGGFDYKYAKGERDDLSYAGWNFQALKAAKAAGCQEKGLPDAIVKSIANLKKRAPAGFTYCNTEARKSGAMRGVGVLCLQLFESAWDGNGKPIPELVPIWKTIMDEDVKKVDWNSPPQNSMYTWYYGTYACFQEGGAVWKSWQKKFEPMLRQHQNPEGYWIYPGDHHAHGDELTEKVHATTFAILMLSVYYRFLPSSKGRDGRVEGAGAAGAAGGAHGKAAEPKNEEEVKL